MMCHMNWNLIRVQNQSQTRFCADLKTRYPDVGFYYPIFAGITRPSGSRRVIPVPTPVYPGYIFVPSGRMNQVQTPHRYHFVRFGGAVALIRDSVIQELRRLESLNQLVVKTVAESPYTPGTRILVHTP